MLRIEIGVIKQTAIQTITQFALFVFWSASFFLFAKILFYSSISESLLKRQNSIFLLILRIYILSFSYAKFSCGFFNLLFTEISNYCNLKYSKFDLSLYTETFFFTTELFHVYLLIKRVLLYKNLHTIPFKLLYIV